MAVCNSPNQTTRARRLDRRPLHKRFAALYRLEELDLEAISLPLKQQIEKSKRRRSDGPEYQAVEELASLERPHAVALTVDPGLQRCSEEIGRGHGVNRGDSEIHFVSKCGDGLRRKDVQMERYVPAVPESAEHISEVPVPVRAKHVCRALRPQDAMDFLQRAFRRRHVLEHLRHNHAIGESTRKARILERSRKNVQPRRSAKLHAIRIHLRAVDVATPVFERQHELAITAPDV